jgi:hypothetical protein
MVLTVCSPALLLYSLYLIYFGVLLLSGKAYLGGSAAPYLGPGIILAASSIVLWLGRMWPILPAFVVSLVPGVWPFLWEPIAAGFAPPPPFLWRELLPLVAPGVVGTMALLYVALRGVGRDATAPVRRLTRIYAAPLCLYGSFLIWYGVWIFLTVHFHAPTHLLALAYAAPGVALVVLSFFLWLGHARLALPAFAISLFPEAWLGVHWTRTPVALGWIGILMLNAPAVFATITAVMIALTARRLAGRQEGS